jgi:hypothetical protein
MDDVRPLVKTPRSSASIASTKPTNPTQNQMLVAIIGSLDGEPYTRRASHYGTRGVVVVSPKAHPLPSADRKRSRAPS